MVIGSILTSTSFQRSHIPLLKVHGSTMLKFVKGRLLQTSIALLLLNQVLTTITIPSLWAWMHLRRWFQKALIPMSLTFHIRIFMDLGLGLQNGRCDNSLPLDLGLSVSQFWPWRRISPLWFLGQISTSWLRFLYSRVEMHERERERETV